MIARRRRAYSSASKTVSILILFLACAIGVLFIFSYFTGLIQFGSGNSNSIEVSGAFSVANGGGSTGTLQILLHNKGPSPVKEVDLRCSSQFQDAKCGGLPVTYNGIPITQQNPVPSGTTASGNGAVHASAGTVFIAGTIYTLTVAVVFSDGTTSTTVLTLPAQG